MFAQEGRFMKINDYIYKERESLKKCKWTLKLEGAKRLARQINIKNGIVSLKF